MRKMFKRFAAMGSAMVMAISVMSMGASAYNLHYSQGAPSSDTKITDNRYIGGYFGQLNHVYIKSETFSRLLPGGYLHVVLKNSSVARNISSTGKFTIATDLYLTGEMIHITYALNNYTTSKSISASGSEAVD